MSRVRHVLGISGGKDSAALAIYMSRKYPELNIEYYTCDTGKELDETYQLIKNLEIFLGKKVQLLQAADGSNEDPFDHFLKMYGGFLPSSNSRWCTKKLKLEPFEKFVGDDLVVSYVGIRGDEDREGYISKKSNIQSIFPFRKNIWSEDVIAKFLSTKSLEESIERARSYGFSERYLKLLNQPVSPKMTLTQKMNLLLDSDCTGTNKLIFAFLKDTQYPLSHVSDFPLIENDDVLIQEDIYKILEDSGVGVPKYYKKVDFKLNETKGKYSRSRSGCYFCFFQQKIEWIWLYEQHPHLFQKAMEYEKDGYSWNQEETLAELIQPERVAKIKEEYLKRTKRISEQTKSPYLLDILSSSEEDGCLSCFV